MQLFADVRENSQFSSEKMKKNSLFSTDRFFCDVYCFEAGQRQAAHTHADSDKVYYVLEGLAAFRSAQKSATFRPVWRCWRQRPRLTVSPTVVPTA